MNSHRILGVILLVVGVILLVIGMNASHSVADQVSNTVTGRFRDATTWYIVGGITTGIIGIIMVLLAPNRKPA